MNDRYKGRDKYLCKNGHPKYVEKRLSFDICNICGTTEATKVDRNQGAVAQQVEREGEVLGVVGSIPTGSTT